MIAMDLRGHGRSDRAKVSVDAMAEDVIEVIKKEKLKSVVLVGNSLGAVIAYCVAKKVPKKVKGLILASMFAKGYVRCAWLIKTGFTAIAKFFSLFKSRRQLVFQDYWKHRDMPVWYFFFIDIKGTSYTTWFAAAGASLAVPVDLTALKMKTLLMQGNHDPLLKKTKLHRQAMQNKFIEFVAIDSHHHILTSEYAYSLREIKRFLAGVKA